MDETNFQAKLDELIKEIPAAPEAERDQFRATAEASKRSHEQLQRTVGSIHDSIDYLRLSIKYLLFDLEATRRENDYLRKILEEEPGSQ